ncbi:sulfatase family protein [Lentzea sp. CA-135723]|uniref:sulfatase family protein n=1 Tax=Lentzea sp. CA-135723 TaxID=3239950 RepID=UPI003D90F310
MSLTRRAFGGLLGTVAAGLSVPAARAEPARRPNVLIILADDLGWADLSCYGSPHIRTPHLDRLAARGIRFTDGYSGSSTCSPTRLSLYTGRYPGRIPAGLEEPIEAPGAGLDPSHPTLASMLRSEGYTTAMIGKWHCGSLPSHSPTKSGWDEFFGNFGGSLEYYSKLDTEGRYDLYEGETPYQDLRYYTRVLTEKATEFVQREHDEPWLLNLNFTTPHWPWIAEGDVQEARRLENLLRTLPPEQKTLAMAHLDGGSVAKYAQMVEDLDRSVGEVLDHVGPDTLVIFSSDNGGERFSYSWPFAGIKGVLQEGGIRVPTIVSWPARLRGGQVSSTPVCTPDWTATVLDLAGAQPVLPLDGVSLAAHLLHGEAAPNRDLFWRTETQRALRRGKWKYYRAEDADLPFYNGKDLLFDLEADPREQANRALHEPALVAALRTAWEAVDADLLPYPEETR